MNEKAVYLSEIEIEKVKGPIRRAYLPEQKEPILFGVHSEVAQHYGVDTERIEPHPATMDYMVAATGG
jgi:hypothetical protein